MEAFWRKRSNYSEYVLYILWLFLAWSCQLWYILVLIHRLQGPSVEHTPNCWLIWLVGPSSRHRVNIFKSHSSNMLKLFQQSKIPSLLSLFPFFFSLSLSFILFLSNFGTRVMQQIGDFTVNHDPNPKVPDSRKSNLDRDRAPTSPNRAGLEPTGTNTWLQIDHHLSFHHVCWLESPYRNPHCPKKNTGLHEKCGYKHIFHTP